MQKDKVGLSIYTIHCAFRISLLPDPALINIKEVFFLQRWLEIHHQFVCEPNLIIWYVYHYPK